MRNVQVRSLTVSGLDGLAQELQLRVFHLPRDQTPSAVLPSLPRRNIAKPAQCGQSLKSTTISKDGISSRHYSTLINHLKSAIFTFGCRVTVKLINLCKLEANELKVISEYHSKIYCNK